MGKGKKGRNKKEKKIKRTTTTQLPKVLDRPQKRAQKIALSYRKIENKAETNENCLSKTNMMMISSIRTRVPKVKLTVYT